MARRKNHGLANHQLMKIPGIFERPPASGVHWVFYRDADGRPHKEKAGQLAAALELLTRRKKEVKNGSYVPPRQARTWSFRRLADEAIKQKSLRLAALSIETDRIRLGQLSPLIGGIPFDRVTTERIEETLGALKRSGLSNSTVNRYRSFISTVFTFALATGRVSANPASRVKRYKENDARVRWLRPEEEDRLRKCISVDYHRWEFDLALHTGMRRGEQFGLKWKDCDLERGILTVKGKTGRRHIVANDTAIGTLKRLSRYTGEKEFVSPDNDGSAQRDWRTWFEHACDEAAVDDFHWHDLRHTFASRLVMAGVDIRTVQELLGHKSIVMTMKYAHLSADHRKAAVAKMNVEAAVPA
jgi:site-specific recombinase XerD